MYLLKKIWNSYLRIGVTSDLDEREARRVTLTNFLIFLALVYAVIRALLSLSDIVYCLKLLGTTTAALSLLFLNHRRFHNAAKIGIICSYGVLIVYFNIKYIGVSQGAHVLLFSFLPWPFMLFDLSQKKQIFTATTVVIGCLFSNLLFYFLNPKPSVPDINIDVALISIYSLSLLIMLFTTWHFASTNDTAEKKLLKEKEQSEAANRGKSLFLANMSHELRTPLNSILGFSQIIEKSENLSARDKENLQIVNRSGEHLLALINDVLDMSKIESGRIVLRESDFDLYHLLDDVGNICKTQSDKKGLYLQFEIQPDAPRFIRADETRLRQALINLLNNAVKFTNEGKIIARLKSNDISDKSNDAVGVQFEIEDTGVGIEPDKMDKIFDPFVQVKGNSSRREGTGLGLPISRKIARLMKGDITVESSVGEGSIFKLHVRVKKLEHVDASPYQVNRKVAGVKPDHSGHTPRYRMLIADDIEDNRRVLSQLLSPAGFEVGEAANGEEAVKLWKEWHTEGHPPDLTWMDIRMPVMNGYEAIREIKRIAGEKGISAAIIAISASTFNQDVEDILSIGADDFMGKPFKESELFEKIHRYLGVNFIYEDSIVNNESDSERDKENALAGARRLPAEWKEDMKRAIDSIDFERMSSLVRQIQNEHKDLANMLRKKLDRFEYENILEIIKEEQGGKKRG